MVFWSTILGNSASMWCEETICWWTWQKPGIIPMDVETSFAHPFETEHLNNEFITKTIVLNTKNSYNIAVSANIGRVDKNRGTHMPRLSYSRGNYFFFHIISLIPYIHCMTLLPLLDVPELLIINWHTVCGPSPLMQTYFLCCEFFALVTLMHINSNTNTGFTSYIVILLHLRSIQMYTRLPRGNPAITFALLLTTVVIFLYGCIKQVVATPSLVTHSLVGHINI